ncbi:NRPS-like enzyme [Pleurostoma richardsiae]|uniref:NRPS-like enzyme n=1 Tax=Pleurostoma richardsiae TaxID=41990 RepID=A0AA38RD16_9PEZI|nr:NRPS-like enzyme [Pleurostoma richardsiae]
MAHTSQENDQKRLTVLLTGSTGSLGTYILDALFDNPHVSKVVCLNRSADARHRQEAALHSRGLKTLSGFNVQFLHAELSQKYLGLDLPDYDALLSSVTTVLHNGWPVDFNRSFSSFQPAVDGVLNLVKFAHACHNTCSIFFISSVGVVQEWPKLSADGTPVPEETLNDWRLAQEGYGQSKMVAERILAEATKVSAIHASICRVAQVAGPVLRGEQGSWNEREWFPTLVSTSQKLKMLPSSLGYMESLDWVPVDLLAKIVVEQLASSESSTSEASKGITTVYHIANPRHAPWASVLPVVQKHLGAGVSVVPPEEWLRALADKVNSPEAASIPGTKLLEFYRGIGTSKEVAPVLDTTQSQKASPTLAAVTAVQPDWMDLWMRQWKANGFIAA